jgi:hypothetical protein
MAKSKSKKSAESSSSVSVTVAGVEYTFSPPTANAWMRYMQKASDDKLEVGKRELVQVCCSSHTPDEIIALLRKKPALIRPLKEALEELSVGDLESVITDHDSVEVSLKGQSFVVGGPDYEKWEKFQSDLGKKNTRTYEQIKALVIELCEGDKAGLSVLLDKYPGAANIIFDDITQLAGAGLEIIVKKG